VQLGEEEGELLCQAILKRFVLPQEQLSGEWLACQHLVDDHVLCLVVKVGNRHLHPISNKLENAALDCEPCSGARVFGETNYELVINHDDIIDHAILIEMCGCDDEGG
jgi:hypothetical protein